MQNLPENVKAFKQTDVFHQNSIPAGLLHEHQLKKDTWGKIKILEGKLVLEFLDSGEIEVLDEQKPGIIPPKVFHQVKALEKVKFFVEFWK